MSSWTLGPFSHGGSARPRRVASHAARTGPRPCHARAGTSRALRSRSAGLAAALVLAVAVSVGSADAPEIDPAILTVLSRDLRFSTGDFSDLTRGKIVKRTLSARTAGEVAAVGAVTIDTSVDRFLAEFRDIARFKSDDHVPQIGRFSDPPSPDDLLALTVGDEDLDARRCQVGHCDVRLPAENIARFSQEIDWNASGARERAAQLFKEMVLDHVRAYWAGGPGRIGEYADGKRPIRPAAEFAGILENSPYIVKLLPDLPAHLLDFPAARMAGAEDFLYWSKERFGFKPFIAVTHVTIARTPSGAAVITSKSVYSSRYVDASLGLTIASQSADGRLVLVYVNRSRANALKGAFSGLRRAIVERRVRGGLEESLDKVRARFGPR